MKIQTQIQSIQRNHNEYSARHQGQSFPLYHSVNTISTSNRRFIPIRSPISHALLTHIADPDYHLREPLLLSIETDASGATVVSESQFNMYGIGDTLEDAIADFVSMLIDYYKELTESESELSCHLRRQALALRRIIAHR